MVVTINNTFASPPIPVTTLSAGGAFYGVIYMATAPCGKSYIGKSTNFAARYSTHKSHGYRGCRAIRAAIEKYGDRMEWRIIGIACDSTSLKAAEKFAIAHYKTLAPNGYNLTEGGEGEVPCAETRQLISIAGKNRPPESAATKAKRAASMQRWREENPEAYQASKRKAGKTKRGKPRSPTTIANMSAGAIGKPWSPARRAAHENRYGIRC